MLRTRAPLSSEPKPRIPSDLHVLGLPLAFILSQDQTLHCIMSSLSLTLLFNNRICKIWWVVNCEWWVLKLSFYFFLLTVVFFLQHPLSLLFITSPSSPKAFAFCSSGCYATWLSIPYKNLSPSPSRFRLYMLSPLTVITFSIFIPKIAFGICPVGRPFLLGLQR